MTRSRLLPASMALAAATLALASAGARADDKALHLTAFAVDIGGPSRARSGTIDITIDRWSSPADAAKLHDAITEKGSDHLLSALTKLPEVGNIRATGNLGWPIHFAQQFTTPDGGRRIVIATDRPMTFWEAMNRPRSAEYEFTLAEIRIGPDGKGEGKLVPAAKIDFDDENKTLEVENYATQPVRLNDVRISR